VPGDRKFGLGFFFFCRLCSALILSASRWSESWRHPEQPGVAVNTIPTITVNRKRLKADQRIDVVIEIGNESTRLNFMCIALHGGEEKRFKSH
jgi:hypothetical protein